MAETNPQKGKHKLNEQGYKLTYGQQWNLGLSAFNDFINIIPTIATGRAQAKSYQFQAMQANVNAELLRRDAQDIIQQGYEEENKIRVQGARTVGEQRTAMSASGFEVSSKSYRELVENTNYNIEMNAQAIRKQAMFQSANKETEAKMSNIQADYYKSAAKASKYQANMQALTSGISGALKTAALSYYGGK